METDAGIDPEQTYTSKVQRKDNIDTEGQPDIPLVAAAKHGIIEIVKAIVQKSPQAVEYVNDQGDTIMHVAIRHRRSEVFDFLRSSKIPLSRLARRINLAKDSLLHLAGILGENRVMSRPGEALHMQLELQWFERVKEVVPSHFLNLRDRKGQTAQELFTKEHNKLRRQGQEWLVRTAESSSVVAGLIATVAFSSAYTVPEGQNEETGLPLLLKRRPFLIFSISNAFSLSFALSSLVIFLSIMTSRFREIDFYRSLTLKLVLGLTTLFLAVAAMMVAFSASLALMVRQELHWAAIPIYFLACCPVTIFLVLQFPLYLRVALSTITSL
ncbi:hypothetical protein HHK36_005698 [Tetracentron sinense]|uniref:PGG domain-containing protein n=1 Tax=Tetracentron sinense TaxID=13715 RepID=A0A834ZPU0_TETSI|nr:hypothetical protein HHK36_005698 [Tetracentron sinense]